MKYKNIEEQEDAIKKSQEEHANTLSDSRIESLEDRIDKLEDGKRIEWLFLEDRIDKLEDRMTILEKAVSKIEINLWKEKRDALLQLQKDHVEYDFIGEIHEDDR